MQNQVAQFAQVCSYDRLGLGKSDKPASPQSADEIVNDLHGLLHAAVSSPDVMVGHSISGIYVRKYAQLYPTEVIGMVLLDSAHEEQFLPAVSEHVCAPTATRSFSGQDAAILASLRDCAASFCGRAAISARSSFSAAAIWSPRREHRQTTALSSRGAGIRLETGLPFQEPPPNQMAALESWGRDG